MANAPPAEYYIIVNPIAKLTSDKAPTENIKDGLLPTCPEKANTLNATNTN